jgi:VanZ family protein
MIRLRWRLLLVGWSLLILFATLYPGNRLPGLSRISFLVRTDTLVHFMLFAVFAFLLVAMLSCRKLQFKLRYLALITILSGIIFGSLTEVLQSFLPIQRDASWSDLLADITGVIAGFATGAIFRRRLIQKGEC